MSRESQMGKALKIILQSFHSRRLNLNQILQLQTS